MVTDSVVESVDKSFLDRVAQTFTDPYQKSGFIDAFGQIRTIDDVVDPFSSESSHMAITMLGYCSLHVNADGMRILLDAGADPTIGDPTPMMNIAESWRAVSMDRLRDAVNLLTGAGAGEPTTPLPPMIFGASNFRLPV